MGRRRAIARDLDPSVELGAPVFACTIQGCSDPAWRDELCPECWDAIFGEARSAPRPRALLPDELDLAAFDPSRRAR
jgi:hypothetical protein